MLTVRGYGKDIESIKSTLAREGSEQIALPELDKRLAGDWFHPQSTTLHILKDLQPLFREFRFGDVKPLQFWMEGSPETMMHQIIPFIYY